VTSVRISSGRILLRKVTPASAQQLYRLAREPKVSEWLQWPPHESIDDSLGFINDAHQLWERKTAFFLGIFDAETDTLMGSTGISSIDRANRRGEVGTWLGLPYQGQGHNLNIKAAVFTFAFDVLGLHRLELLVKAPNERSYRANLKIPGVIDEGLQHSRLWTRGTCYDAHMLAVTRESYDAADYPSVGIEGALS
jgi:ribosomal-protein-alanine N-acetyltransferase